MQCHAHRHAQVLSQADAHVWLTTHSPPAAASALHAQVAAHAQADAQAADLVRVDRAKAKAAVHAQEDVLAHVLVREGVLEITDKAVVARASVVRAVSVQIATMIAKVVRSVRVVDVVQAQQ